MTQAYNLSQMANNLDSSGRLDATDGLVNAVPVANGGTGASSVPAAVSNLSSSIWPVGSIYINAGVSTNPATLLGFGTWVAFGSGRVLVGLNTSDSAFDTLQETGGSKDAVLVSHSHTATASTVGDHIHGINGGTGVQGQVGAGFGYGASNDNTAVRITNTDAGGDHTHTVTVDAAGSSGTNANYQPYITVYMWKRTA